MTVGRARESVLGDVKQIEAGPLNVGYVDRGPADGPAVVLLHGWPYDIHSFAEVVPLLTAAGKRVIVPYLRGFGTTRFLSDAALRNGEQAALALDAVALMDALDIETAIVAGFDWGARSADVVAALWPNRCNGLVSVSGYLIGSQTGGTRPLPPEEELQWWYQYYFATERGRAGYEKYRREFAKLIWRSASPEWDFDQATFDRSAASFDNPDHVAVVIHNYRWRLGLAEGEPEHLELEEQLAGAPVITVPAITLDGDRNGAPHPSRMPTRRSSPDRTHTGQSKAALGTTSLRRRQMRSPLPYSNSVACHDLAATRGVTNCSRVHRRWGTSGRGSHPVDLPSPRSTSPTPNAPFNLDGVLTAAADRAGADV
jgi:pimeloyl-ACP methyl ester carboxylesterase